MSYSDWRYPTYRQINDILHIVYIELFIYNLLIQNQNHDLGQVYIQMKSEVSYICIRSDWLEADDATITVNKYGTLAESVVQSANIVSFRIYKQTLRPLKHSSSNSE